jgi:hypothetical protein
MKYTQIPTDTFQSIQLNAGVLVTSFEPSTGEYSGLLGATTGGNDFKATPTFTDFGEDIDNCPKNMKELKKLESWEVTLDGTFVTVKASTAKKLIAAADADSQNANHIIPRKDLESSDFQDIWWIGDYSDVNTGATAGYIAIHMMNALNTGGFEIKSTDKAKGQFAFTFTGHVSMDAQDVVPFEIYIKNGGSSSDAGIYLNKHTLNLAVDGTEQLVPTVSPAGTTITWSSSSTTYATVSDGLVTGEAAGSAIITASITVEGVTYTDTCTVIVVQGA